MPFIIGCIIFYPAPIVFFFFNVCAYEHVLKTLKENIMRKTRG